MSKLNGDILYLIFKHFQDNIPTLYSCLLVNKTWCGIIIPILWKNPWKILKFGKEESLLNVIISHLSDEVRNNLIQNIDFLINSYQRPLFNYISFCKHLDFEIIERIIPYSEDEDYEIPLIKNELVNLFINENTKFTHLYLSHLFDYQIHIIPGAKHCFSELEFISCYTNMNDNVLDGLIEICKPIKELKLFIAKCDNNYGFVKLIKAIKSLSKFHLTEIYLANYSRSFREVLENSLIQHAGSIQYFTITDQLVTKILKSFTNLKRLELGGFNSPGGITKTWNHLENLTLPNLQILKTEKVPIKVLTSLIKNTSGYLTVIKINNGDHNNIENKRIIQVIYQNCPKLKSLKLAFMNSNILELEQLLINCQYLYELHFVEYSLLIRDGINWDNVFEILTKSSPASLFEFIFYFNFLPGCDSLKLFLKNWKGRHPMIIKLSYLGIIWDGQSEYINLLKEYKAEGIVENYEVN
ncbi:hypothetical protein C1645_811153 [Glomus cerebriforme]|uniref:F-box domain-containing protein n=1 Tax=Glomus cerebriforme TaxID=658196 RepID=A0A397TPD9_9GLOM|nr:hypothetical protein C1645_811153 [Glomus cerebriforme]